MGTPIYVAPEIIEGKEYSGEKVDVFACGVVLFIMLTGRYPFYAATLADKRYKFLIEGKTEGFWSAFENKFDISEDVKILLSRMFTYQPTERYSLDQISVHPWYQDINQQDS
jgi:serine/threonine protein kinase